MRIRETYTTCCAEESQGAIDLPTDGRTLPDADAAPARMQTDESLPTPCRHVFVPKKVRVREDLETTTARHARARSCSQPATNRALHPLMRYGRVPLRRSGRTVGAYRGRSLRSITARRDAGGQTYGFDRCVSYGSRGWMDSSLRIWRRPFFLHGAAPSPFSTSLALRLFLGASSTSS
jgi:hypothetical protein